MICFVARLKQLPVPALTRPSRDAPALSVAHGAKSIGGPQRAARMPDGAHWPAGISAADRARARSLVDDSLVRSDPALGDGQKMAAAAARELTGSKVSNAITI